MNNKAIELAVLKSPVPRLMSVSTEKLPYKVLWRAILVIFSSKSSELFQDVTLGRYGSSNTTDTNLQICSVSIKNEEISENKPS